MRARVLLTALVGLAFPIGLALAVYAAAGRPLTATPVVAPVTTRAIAQPTRSTPSTATTDDRRRGRDRSDDDSGRLGTTTVDDDGGGSNSGPGSSNSGSGSGGSGNSGSGGDD
jgi:uncharacterized membrane protein YgcG